MVVGVGIIDIWIHESNSLKAKRSVLKSIIRRTQNRFNVSIAEIGDNDHWKKGRIGFSIVGNDRRFVNGKIDNILQFVQNMHLADVIKTKVEITNYSDIVEDIEADDFEDLLNDFQEGRSGRGSDQG
ncbi:MAG: DUF503 domain-containing protein [Deltaproteobacteria bacterium]|nr:DUF503 domain-containing protein [Deltaproteobacteria bacterium]